MTRADSRLVIRIGIAIVSALIGLYVVGLIFRWLYPPTDVESFCLSKSVREFDECVQEWFREHPKGR